MVINVKSISNPGISFTDDVNEKLILLYQYVEENKGRQVTYSEFQTELIENKIFINSYIRSFIPFIRNFGIINEYSSVDYNNFFTSTGKLYIENLIDCASVKVISEEEISNYFKRTKENILCLCLDYLCENKISYFEKYLDILYYVKKYNKICKNEFYIYEYCKVNKIKCDELIKMYRENPNSIEIRIVGRHNKDVENNAFNYFIALLSEEQCNYVCKIDQMYYKINSERIRLVDSILNEYIEYGG